MSLTIRHSLHGFLYGIGCFYYRRGWVMTGLFRGEVDKEAACAIMNSHLFVRATKNNGLSLVINHEFRSVKKCCILLDRIFKFMQFDKLPKLYVDSANKTGMTMFSYELQQAIEEANNIKSEMDYFSLHPRLVFFIDFCNSNNVAKLIFNGMFDDRCRDELNNVLNDLKNELNSKKMMDREYAFMKGSIKNGKSLRAYVDGLFSVYARLLVIRVDLAYMSEHQESVTVEIALNHKTDLINNRLKSSVRHSWVGYACRLEFAKSTGYHFHLVVFLNGAKYKNDVHHAQLIIKEWSDITNGMGRGFNCNMNTKNYRFCGIGVVNHHDDEKKENLNKALAYLTKQDSIAKLKIGNRRTFFKGCLPKRSAKSGRKRSRNV